MIIYTLILITSINLSVTNVQVASYTTETSCQNTLGKAISLLPPGTIIERGGCIKTIVDGVYKSF